VADKDTLEDLLSEMDLDENGSLDYKEFLKVMRVYSELERAAEGFTKAELADFKQVFTKFDSDRSGELEMMEYERVLTYMGRVADKDTLEDLLSEMDLDENGSLDYKEFLKVMRVYSELERELFRQTFQNADADGSGEMDSDELQALIRELGYYPTSAMIQEIFEVFDADKSGSLGVEEFIKVMGYFQSNSGFTSSEMDEYRNAFEKFDPHNQGHVSTTLTTRVLRSLGYVIPASTICTLVEEVDVDNSQALDFGELIKFLRIHRYEEMIRAEKAWQRLRRTQKATVMPKDRLEEWLTACHYPATQRVIKLCAKGFERDLTWANMQTIVERVRQENLLAYKERAGFTEDEARDYKKHFAAHCGIAEHLLRTITLEEFPEIPLGEVYDLLKRVGQQPRTQLQMDRWKDVLRDADEDKSGTMDFMEFLFLLRKFRDEADTATLMKEKSMADSCRFTEAEVETFRQIFADFDRNGDERFDLSEVETLLRRIGVDLDEKKQELEQLFCVVAGSVTGFLDFAEFLLMIRKLLDADFGGLHALCAGSGDTTSRTRKSRMQLSTQERSNTMAELRRKRTGSMAATGGGARMSRSKSMAVSDSKEDALLDVDERDKLRRSDSLQANTPKFAHRASVA